MKNPPPLPFTPPRSPNCSYQSIYYCHDFALAANQLDCDLRSTRAAAAGLVRRRVRQQYRLQSTRMLRYPGEGENLAGQLGPTAARVVICAATL